VTVNQEFGERGAANAKLKVEKTYQHGDRAMWMNLLKRILTAAVVKAIKFIVISIWLLFNNPDDANARGLVGSAIEQLVLDTAALAKCSTMQV
jgi:uncharacterized MnhB-related membrane protein